MLSVIEVGFAVEVVSTFWALVIGTCVGLTTVAIKNRNRAELAVSVQTALCLGLNLGIDIVAFLDAGSGHFPPVAIASIFLLIKLPSLINYNIPALSGFWILAFVHATVFCFAVASFNLAGSIISVIATVLLGSAVMHGNYTQKQVLYGYIIKQLNDDQGFSAIFHNDSLDGNADNIISGIEILVKNILSVEKILKRELKGHGHSATAELRKALDLINQAKTEIREEENVYKVIIDTFNKVVDPDDR
jgi:hypothetical protein